MRLASACLLFMVGFVPPAHAQATKAPVVVELFTSQACSSCPPAEAHFRDLAKRSDLLTLEWHVDYWDDFEDRVGGRYKDPFSSKAHTARQLLYNRRLVGKDNVFTPQVVVGGAAQTTGTDKPGMQKAIGKQKDVPVGITAAKSDAIIFNLENLPADAELMLVTFQKEISTRVAKGENHGKELASAHVVTAYKQLKPVPSFRTALPASGSGCALLVHAKGQGPILGAAYCPE
jgi:hypothetical protein